MRFIVMSEPEEVTMQNVFSQNELPVHLIT